MEFKSILPNNATQLERDIEASVSRFEKFSTETILDIWQSETCPLDIVTWLSWTLSVEIWKLDWPESIKRDFLKKSVELHLKKGTRHSIDLILSCLGIKTYRIVEWWELEPRGTPYTFTLAFSLEEGYDPELFTSSNYKFVQDAINAVKPVRASYDFGAEAASKTSFSLANQLKIEEISNSITPHYPLNTLLGEENSSSLGGGAVELTPIVRPEAALGYPVNTLLWKNNSSTLSTAMEVSEIIRSPEAAFTYPVNALLGKNNSSALSGAVEVSEIIRPPEAAFSYPVNTLLGKNNSPSLDGAVSFRSFHRFDVTL